MRFETRTGKTYIFEVMDTEVQKQAQVVAHVIEALFTPQVLKVFFIVSNSTDQETVSKVADIVLGRLSEMCGRKLNKQVRFYYVVISPKDARSSGRVAEILAETGEIFA